MYINPVVEHQDVGDGNFQFSDLVVKGWRKVSKPSGGGQNSGGLSIRLINWVTVK